jgi:hypothetical protein
LLNPDDGQFDIYERERFRAQLVWRKVPTTPDEPRILAEIHRRHLEKTRPDLAGSFAGLTMRTVGDCLLGHAAEGQPCHASVYQPGTKLLVQWVFPDCGDDALRSIEPLLRSYRPNCDDVRRWELFGIRVSLPRAFTFSGMKPEPANVAISFETDRHLSVVASRIGMVGAVLANLTLPQLHRALLRRRNLRILSSQEREIKGRRGVYTRFERRGERRLEQLTGRFWQGEAFLWHDMDEGRLYGIEQVGPPKEKRLELLDACQA